MRNRQRPGHRRARFDLLSGECHERARRTLDLNEPRSNEIIEANLCFARDSGEIYADEGGSSDSRDSRGEPAAERLTFSGLMLTKSEAGRERGGFLAF
jgi:hypothetical protein